MKDDIKSIGYMIFAGSFIALPWFMIEVFNNAFPKISIQGDVIIGILTILSWTGFSFICNKIYRYIYLNYWIIHNRNKWDLYWRKVENLYGEKVYHNIPYDKEKAISRIEHDKDVFDFDQERKNKVYEEVSVLIWDLLEEKNIEMYNRLIKIYSWHSSV